MEQAEDLKRTCFQNAPAQPFLSIPSAKTLSCKIPERENWDYGKKKCSPFGKRLLSETAKECTKMSNNNNQLNIPEAREAMDRFKMQAAQEEEDVSPTS